MPTGCVSDIKNANQFIEVLSSEGKELGIILESKKVDEFIDNLKMESWEYSSGKSENSKVVGSFVDYENIEKSYVRKDIKELHKDDDKYYIVQESDVIQIPENTGKYLVSIYKSKLITDISAQEVIDKWGLDVMEAGKDEDEEKVSEEFESEIEDDLEPEFLDASGIKRIEVTYKDGNKTEIIQKKHKSEFFSNLNLKDWVLIDRIPDECEEAAVIISYGQKRRSFDKKEVAMSKETLCKKGTVYYIESRIFGNVDGREDQVEYYQISEKSAKDILSFSNHTSP